MSEAIAKPRSKSLQRRDAKLALKASKRYKRMQQREPAPKLTGKQRVLNWLLHIIMALMVIYCLVPLLWVIFSATRPTRVCLAPLVYGSMTRMCSGRMFRKLLHISMVHTLGGCSTQ